MEMTFLDLHIILLIKKKKSCNIFVTSTGNNKEIWKKKSWSFPLSYAFPLLIYKKKKNKLFTLVCKASVSSGTKYIRTNVSNVVVFNGKIKSFASIIVTISSTPSSR